MKRAITAFVMICYLGTSASALPAGQAVNKVVWQSANQVLTSLSVLMILKGAEMVAKRVRSSKLTDHKASPSMIAKYAGEAALEMLDEPSVWAGITGNLASSALVGEPITRLFFSMTKNSRAQKVFKQSLQAGIIAAIASIGWQIGTELWTQARENLKDPESYEKAGHVKSIAAGVATLARPSKRSHAQFVKEMMSNMLDILFKDSAARRRLLTGVWRNNIAHGEFFSPLIGISGATWLALRVLGGSTQAVTTAFSIAGGVLSIFIPREVVQSLTEFATWGRRSVATEFFEKCKMDSGRLAVHTDPEEEPGALLNYFESCQRYRNQLVSMQIETLYLNYHRLQDLLREREMAVKARNHKVLPELHTNLMRGRQKIREATQFIRELYGQQIDLLLELQAYATQPAVEQMNCELNKLQKTLSLLNSVLTTMDPKFIDSSFSNFQITLVDKYYAEGFHEQDLLEAISGTTPLPECRPERR